jgi:hypothetical protein
MRVLSGVFALVILGGIAAAQAPSSKPAPAPAPKPAPSRAAAPASSSRPDGDLAQVMRGILFPNSNLLFDVQQNDPGAPPKKAEDGQPGASTTSTFANIYTGWQVVENASVALEEAADMIMKPGRVCSNGKPVPVGRPDYVKFARGLREAGHKAFVAAKTKNQEKVSDVTNDVSEACANCHEVYRDKGPAGSPARCTP